MDVVALNVARRTAAYSWRLRLSEGGTLPARSVVITTGVTCRSYAYVGSYFGLNVPASKADGEALLRQAFVPGPGVRP